MSIGPKIGQMNKETEELDQLTAIRVSSLLKELLEQKALYQSLAFDAASIVEGLSPQELSKEKRDFLFSFASREWKILAGYSDYSGFGSPHSSADRDVPPINIPIPKIKAWCKACHRIEPFGVSRASEINIESYGRTRLTPVLTQTFYLSYSCQSCDGYPEVFLVRRQEGKVTLCGRSQIAHLKVPKVIPKDVARYFSDALVAFQAGQFLSANFLMRVLIEQWVNSVIEKPTKQADRNLDSYVESLPADFKSRFPCLRDEYGLLSADIHEAIGSQDLFCAVRDRVIDHFAARATFKL